MEWFIILYYCIRRSDVGLQGSAKLGQERVLLDPECQISPNLPKPETDLAKTQNIENLGTFARHIPRFSISWI